ncbi:MAG: Arc family DNA-binding protein [Acidobacteriota bacterium]
MSSVTLRDVPPELHKELKESAERNRRSLNAEILWRLENSVGPIRRVSVEEIKQKAERFREHLRAKGFTTTDEEITRFKREGRP